MRHLMHVKTILASFVIFAGCGPSETKPKDPTHVETKTAPKPVCSPSEAVAQSKALRTQGRIYTAAKVLFVAREACKPVPFPADDSLVELLVELGRYQDARRIVGTKKIERLDTLEGAPTPSDVDGALEHVRIAEEAWGKSEFAKASEEWLAAWKLVHPNAQHLANAGRAMEASGKIVEARALYDRALVEATIANGSVPQLEIDLVPATSITFVGWNAKGTKLAYAAGKTLRVLDAPSWTPSLLLDLDGTINQGTWAPDESIWIATTTSIGRYDPRTGARTKTLPGTSCVSLSRDGKTIAYAKDNAIVVADAASGTVLKTLKTKDGKAPRTIALAPNGKLLAAASTSFEVFDALGSGKPVFTQDDTLVTGFAFSPDSMSIVFGMGNELMRWALGKTASRINFVKRLVGGVTYSPDGKHVASTGTLTTYVYPARFDDKVELAFRGHNDGTTAVAFDPTSKLLASGAKDGGLRVFRLDEEDTSKVVFPTRDPVDPY